MKYKLQMTPDEARTFRENYKKDLLNMIYGPDGCIRSEPELRACNVLELKKAVAKLDVTRLDCNVLNQELCFHTPNTHTYPHVMLIFSDGENSDLTLEVKYLPDPKCPVGMQLTEDVTNDWNSCVENGKLTNGLGLLNIPDIGDADYKLSKLTAPAFFAFVPFHYDNYLHRLTTSFFPRKSDCLRNSEK